MPAGLPDGHVLLGFFGAAHGVKGEVRLKSHTADPLAIASYGPLLAADGRTFEIMSARLQKDMVIVRIKGVGDRTQAEGLVNLDLYGPRSAFGKTGDDEFFHADLIGLKAETEDGVPFGRVTGLFNFGAGDLLEIAPTHGPLVLLPFTKAAVPIVDVPGGRIVVVPLPETDSDERPHDDF